jgi:hypothetical protein
MMGAAFVLTCPHNSTVYGQASIVISGEIGSDPGQNKQPQRAVCLTTTESCKL